LNTLRGLDITYNIDYERERSAAWKKRKRNPEQHPYIYLSLAPQRTKWPAKGRNQPLPAIKNIPLPADRTCLLLSGRSLLRKGGKANKGIIPNRIKGKQIKGIGNKAPAKGPS
jgi:hypothetical protein